MGMTLEEAVKRAEEVAEKCEFDTDWGMGNHFIDRSEVTDIIKCGEEHRQLAEWLKELKYYREKSEEQADIESVKSFLSDYCRENDIYVISHDVINEDNYHYSIHILTEEITETEHRYGTRIELRKKQGDTA